MKPKHHFILYTFLGLTAAIAIFLAADYGLRAERSAQALEDTYTQRMLEAQEHLQSISLKLSKTPAAGNARTQVELLTGVSRQADGVVSDLTALPLSHIAMSNTIKFCNQLSEYTLALALLSASGQELSAQTAEKLADLENQCMLLLGQLATARDSMLAQSLKLSAQDGVFYQAAQLSARPLEQVADPDNGMDYPSMIYDGAFSDARHAGEPKALGMEQVDQAQAVEIAREFIGADRVKTAQPGVETGGVLPCYGVTLTLHDGSVLNADVTRQGGKLLWIMPEHASFQPRLTLEECTLMAQQFLLSRGYGEMEANHYQVYDGMAVINFVPLQHGVLLYPDLIKLQIRMDTGEVVGLESNNYLMNHTIRSALVPSLSAQQARNLVSKRLSLTGERLCVIPYRHGERLCWEMSGTYQENEYRVYVDAQTGEELEVLMMIQEPSGRMAA